MENIVQFPGLDERKLGEVLTVVRNVIIGEGANPALADWVVEDLRPRLRSANVSAPLALSLVVPSEAVAQIVRGALAEAERHLQNSVYALLFEMIRLEIDLYFARHGGGGGRVSLGPGIAEKLRLAGVPFGIIDGGKKGDD